MSAETAEAVGTAAGAAAGTVVGMDPVRIVLAGAWISLMLIYLLGDVLRIFSGDATLGRIDGTAATSGMWLAAALIMLVPIAMILVSLLTPAEPLRWITVVVSAALVVFNLFGDALSRALRQCAAHRELRGERPAHLAGARLAAGRLTGHRRAQPRRTRA